MKSYYLELEIVRGGGSQTFSCEAATKEEAVRKFFDRDTECVLVDAEIKIISLEVLSEEEIEERMQ